MSNRKYYSIEAQNQARVERTLIAMCFLGVGLGIGTAIALLFAPQKGDELRDELADRSNSVLKDSRKVIEQKWDDVRDGAEEALKRVQN